MSPAQDCLADSYRNKYSISLKDVQVNGFFVGELNFISAFATVLMRWAITMTVLSFSNTDKASCTSVSLSASIEAVASFPLAQPAQTRINTGLFKKSKDN